MCHFITRTWSICKSLELSTAPEVCGLTGNLFCSALCLSLMNFITLIDWNYLSIVNSWSFSLHKSVHRTRAKRKKWKPNKAINKVKAVNAKRGDINWFFSFFFRLQSICSHKNMRIAQWSKIDNDILSSFALEIWQP